jgi:F-type H+-transporting ATPase subunit gamma
MEMVSVAKMKRGTDMVNRGRSYAKYALELLANIAGVRDITHPLLTSDSKAKRELVIVISSNKGLAGAYNSNISKALNIYSKEKRELMDCLTIGKQSEKSARRNNLNIIASFVDFSEKSTSEEFLIIRDMIIEKFKSESYAKISILFTEFKSSVNYKPYLMQLIPVVPEIYKNLLIEENTDSNKESFKDYTFEPNEMEVLAEIIPQIINAAIYHAFIESVASEHSARMFAMKNANDNAGELLDELTLFYNQARQAAITQEISEIVSGAAALN